MGNRVMAFPTNFCFAVALAATAIAIHAFPRDGIVPEQTLAEPSPRAVLVAKVRHCEHCINNKLHDVFEEYKNCASGSCGSHSKHFSQVAADIESEADKAVMFDDELVPQAAQAHIIKLKKKFDQEFRKVKKQFLSCVSDKAKCNVSKFKHHAGATAQLTKLRELLPEELLLEVPMRDLDEDVSQDSSLITRQPGGTCSAW